MPIRKYTPEQIAKAKAARMCGISVKTVSKKMGVNVNYMTSGTWAAWDHTEPDRKFIEQFNALFQTP